MLKEGAVTSAFKKAVCHLQDGFVLKRSVSCLELYPMEEWNLMMQKN
jgi:MraZ protein